MESDTEELVDVSQIGATHAAAEGARATTTTFSRSTPATASCNEGREQARPGFRSPVQVDDGDVTFLRDRRAKRDVPADMATLGGRAPRPAALGPRPP